MTSCVACVNNHVGLEQLTPEKVCARLGFNPEVESGGKGGERSVLTWDRVCVCVCVCVNGNGRSLNFMYVK